MDTSVSHAEGAIIFLCLSPFKHCNRDPRLLQCENIAVNNREPSCHLKKVAVVVQDLAGAQKWVDSMPARDIRVKLRMTEQAKHHRLNGPELRAMSGVATLSQGTKQAC